MATVKKSATTKAPKKRTNKARPSYLSDALLEIQFTGGGTNSAGPAFGGTINHMIGSNPSFNTLQDWLTHGWRIKQIAMETRPYAMEGGLPLVRYALVWLQFD